MELIKTVLQKGWNLRNNTGGLCLGDWHVIDHRQRVVGWGDTPEQALLCARDEPYKAVPPRYDYEVPQVLGTDQCGICIRHPLCGLQPKPDEVCPHLFTDGG